MSSARSPHGAMRVSVKGSDDAAGAANRVMDVEGHRLLVTDPDGPAWTGAAISKSELLAHYLAADALLPFLGGRATSVVRRMEGGLEPWVFDRSPGVGLPSWIATCQTRPEFSNTPVEAVVVDDRATLAHLVSGGCLAFHPWSATCLLPDRPDRMLFDIDPTEIAFREVRNAALLVRDLLARYQIQSWVKTSGGRGLHVLVPVRAVHSFDEIRRAASLIARMARTREPKLFSFEMRRSRRRGRILIDTERNRPGASLISPFSVKPESGLVSMPLEWAQLERVIYPEDYPVQARRVGGVAMGAPLQGFFDHPQSLEALLDAVHARERRRA